MFNWMYTKKLRKEFLPFTRPMWGVLGEGWRWGGPQRGGPSWWSWQMILPPLQRLPSRPPQEEQGQWRRATVVPRYASSGEAVEQWDHEMQDSRRNKRGSRSQQHWLRRRRRAPPRDQIERRETRQSATRQPRSTGHADAEHDSTWPKEKIHREAKWRKNKRKGKKISQKNKSKSMEKAKARVRGGLVRAWKVDNLNPLEFGGERKTIGKLWVHRTKLRTSQR